jgi:hypothetical protein
MNGINIQALQKNGCAEWRIGIKGKGIPVLITGGRKLSMLHYQKRV